MGRPGEAAEAGHALRLDVVWTIPDELAEYRFRSMGCRLRRGGTTRWAGATRSMA